MPSPRRRSPRSGPTLRFVCTLSALALISACTANVAGTPVTPSLTAGAGGSSAGSSGSSPHTSSGNSPTGQITEPSVLPGGSSATPGTATPPTTSISTATSAGVPPGLAKFYSQQLQWEGCAGYSPSSTDVRIYASSLVQCARLTVPMAYADPTGPTVTVGLIRKVATDPSSRIGSLIMNPGGPGVSGMSFVAEEAVIGDFKALNRHFDLVGFDPRGVGSATPLIECQTDAQLDANRARDERSNTPAAVAASNAQLQQYAAGCVTLTGSDGKVDAKTFLANVGTREVARDLDVMRAALGDSKLTYAGFSYGTRIGYVYAEEFPKNVRAMLYDGDVDPDLDPATSELTQVKGFQQAFVTFAGWCAQQSSCALGTDPQQASAVFQSLSRPLLTTPLAVAGGRVLSYGDAVLGVEEAMYDDSEWPTLRTALADLAAHQGKGLMALADEYYGRNSAGVYSRKPDAFNAIRCVDEPRMTDPGDVIKLNVAEAKAAPFEDDGDPAADIPDVCAYWPVPATLGPHQLKVPGLPKVLVISTTGDPATPYQDGVDLAKQLGAVLLTFQGTRHTAYLAGNACVTKAANNYLLNIALPKAGTVCS